MIAQRTNPRQGAWAVHFCTAPGHRGKRRNFASFWCKRVGLLDFQ
ncbi:MAG: hypothetical protein EBR73_00910 [Rhodobacteraceae bacterium]|nr:hypothetical protein [Paracoccaceae bacterium]